MYRSQVCACYLFIVVYFDHKKCLLVILVQKGSGLLTKGKNNTNDCFVTIALGKIKYQTSVKEKAQSTVEWHEECEL